MHSISFRISRNYALELSGLHGIRKFKDGVSFLELTINLDLFKWDHNPHFRIMLVLLNFKVLEFEIYSVHHLKEGAYW